MIMTAELEPALFDPEEDDEEGPFDLVDKCIIALHEKRRSTREAAMAALVGALEGFVPIDDVDYRYLTVFARCCFSLKKGSAREAGLAYRAIGLLALTLGAGCGGSKEILAEAFPLLVRTVQTSSDGPRVVAALDCLAAVTFAGARGDPDETSQSMKAIWGVIDPRSAPKLAGPAMRTSPQVLAAAVSAWAFVLTTVGEWRTDPSTWKETIPHLAKLLEADDRAVRMAAGEALAVCVELNLTQHASPEDMEAIETAVSDLAAEAGGKGADKRRLTEQKDLFRRIDAFMKHGECPEKSGWTSSSSRRGVLKVSTWAKLVQLNFLKRFLGKGFLSHVQDNALFRLAFSVSSESCPGGGRRRSGLCELKKRREISWETKQHFQHC